MRLLKCISNRLAELTRISTQSLHFFNVRCKEVAADPALGGMQMRLPFILLSTHMEQLIAKDPAYFEVEVMPIDPDIAASTFVNSREYRNHPLVQECCALGETVVPVALYSDGVAVGEDPHKDSSYVVYVSYLHNPAEEAGKQDSKFVFTVYRKV